MHREDKDGTLSVPLWPIPAAYLKRLRNLSTLSLVTMVTGNVDARVDLLALLDLEHGLDAGDAFLERILLNDGDDPALVYALDRLRGEVPAEHLDLIGSLLAGHGRNGADQRRLTRGVNRVHVGIGGHQVFGRGQRDVLDVLAIDRVEKFHPAVAFCSRP